MNVGIIGLKSSGKTSLFNALTRGTAETSAYGGRSKDVNLGMISVPDQRFDWLVEHYHPRKNVPATIEFVDGMAELDHGGHKGQLGKDFFSTVRSSDVLVAVVRAFEDPTVPHPLETVNPERDARTIASEILLADLQLVERRLERLEKGLKGGRGKAPAEVARQAELLTRIQAALEEEKPVSRLGLTPEEKADLVELQFLSDKTLVLVANIGEGALGTPGATAGLEPFAKEGGYPLVSLCAKAEMEVAQLPEDEEAEFLAALGIDEPGRNHLLRLCYQELGLISFFTVGEDEVKAWTLRRGQNAVEAAGKIHSDLARGFIRAEVIAYDALKESGNWNAAKEKGHFRLEGKEYIVQDGDCLNIRFSV
ncbi:MAG TPA: redox-regulated ATPase YchF [Armatimonadota bacterium]